MSLGTRLRMRVGHSFSAAGGSCTPEMTVPSLRWLDSLRKYNIVLKDFCNSSITSQFTDEGGRTPRFVVMWCAALVYVVTTNVGRATAKQASAFLFSSFAITCTYEREFVLTTCSKNGADSIYCTLAFAYATAPTHSQQLIHSVTTPYQLPLYYKSTAAGQTGSPTLVKYQIQICYT